MHSRNLQTPTNETAAEVEQLRASLAHLAATLEATGDGIIVVDLAGEVTSVNARLSAIFGQAAEAFVGRTARDLLNAAAWLFHDPERTRQFVRDAARAPEAERSGLWELVDHRVVEVATRPQRIGGEVVGRVWCFRDVTRRVETERRLAHQAYHDALTGLPNRARFRQRAEETLEQHRRQPEAVTVLVLDLDGFKAVNDTLGHGGGDALLVQVADRLLGATRGCDMVARLGGDEFAVLLANVRAIKDVNIVADRILHVLRTPFYVAGTHVTVSASIGIARGVLADDVQLAHLGSARTAATADGERLVPASGYDLVLRHADLALYLTKAEGRGRYMHFDPAMYSAYLERRATGRALGTALEDGHLRLVYQPIVSLDDGRLVSVEALLRWHDPVRGAVPPGQIVSVAEETGLMLPLGRWILEQACRQRMAWAEGHPDAPPFSMTVNVSRQQLRHEGFVDTVAEVLTASGLSAGHLMLEFTEGTVIDDPALALARMERLRALGVHLALDDFGTGYSALGYLQRFPIDALKIDKTFVDGVTRGGSYAALTSAIIALGTALSLTTIAEGVETPEQEAALRKMGCTLGQGYLFHHPLPAGDLQARLLDGRAGAGRP